MIHWLVVLNNGMMIQWLVVLNNGMMIHWLVGLNNGVMIHWLVVLNNGMMIHWLVVLNNGMMIRWLLVLSRCKNRGMCNKWLVSGHMMCNTRSLLSAIAISRKGNNMCRSHMATYKNFPHAGKKSDFLNSHRVRHRVRIASTYNAGKQHYKKICLHIETAMRWLLPC